MTTKEKRDQRVAMALTKTEMDLLDKVRGTTPAATWCREAVLMTAQYKARQDEMIAARRQGLDTDAL